MVLHVHWWRCAFVCFSFWMVCLGFGVGECLCAHGDINLSSSSSVFVVVVIIIIIVITAELTRVSAISWFSFLFCLLIFKSCTIQH